MLWVQLLENFDTLLEPGFTGISRADYRGLHALGSQYWLDAEVKTTPVEVEEQSLPMSRFLSAMLFALLLVGCATTRLPHEFSEAIPASDSAFGRSIQAQAAAHEGRSGFRLLPNSSEAFRARAELIRNAQKSRRSAVLHRA